MQPQRLEPQEGQESVWDYPRPPVTDPTDALITVAFGDHEIVRTTSAIRVLETSQPPAFYIPRDHVDMSMLEPCIGRSFCEWKGDATYFDLLNDDGRIEQVAWTYESPNPAFGAITGYLAFYAQKVDCAVDGERVEPNEGSFYGGWITSRVVGPFKGSPGSNWW